MKTRNPDSLSGQDIHELVTGLIVARPFALVTTRSPDCVLNCASFSFYQGVCGDPPIISLSIAPDQSKETFRNIMLNGEFVIHTPRSDQRSPLEDSKDLFQAEGNEIEESGFTPTDSQVVEVPGLREPPVRFECRLNDQFPVAGANVTVVYGRIVCFHFNDEVFDGDTVNYDRYDPLGPLGDDNHRTLGDSSESDEEAVS